MRFDVRRNDHFLRTILILAASFTAFSLLAFLIGGPETGRTMLMISGVFLMYFTLEQGKAGWRYEIDEDSLTVKRTIRRYRLTGRAIVKVAKAGWPGIWERVRTYRSGGGPVASESTVVALGRFIGFSAVSIPIRGDQPKGRDVFVIVTMQNGREYALSPANPELFLKECQRLISRTRNHPS